MTGDAPSRTGAMILILLFCAAPVSAQEPAKSAALKSYRGQGAPALVRPYDETARLWQEFMLVRNANSGDAAAEHELGLRYLFGEGFIADTAKAAYWIAKAAAQKLPTACFNYGIMLNNGWGTPWDPFAAYASFQYAASRGVPEAAYSYGLFLLDDLAVRRDEFEARCWIKCAADSAYAPAVKLFEQLDRRGVGVAPSALEKKSQRSASPSGTKLGLIFLDFSGDTSAHVSDELLLDDMSASPVDSGRMSAPLPSSPSAVARLDGAALRDLEQFSRVGNPEALTLLARHFERRENPDPIAATLAYERAIRFESPRAPELLWDLTRSKGYFETLRAAVESGSADAAVAWAGLAALGFDHQVTDEQAFEFLAEAAKAGHPQAMIELGLCYLTGRWTVKDKARGLEWWMRAEQLGSEEAALRLISTQLLSPGETPPDSAGISRLAEASRLGSLQADLALAYALESGRSMPKDIPEAVKAYRTIAQRGSRVAYESLKRMYDAVRPKDVPEFDLSE